MNRTGRRACAMLLLIALAGCHPAMSNHSSANNAVPEGGFDNSSARWPLEFRAHYIGVITYSTYDCKAYYAGGLVAVDDEGELQISSESVGDKYPGVLNASRGPYRNFPSPMVVTWRSKGGEPHRAEVDIGGIFRDQRVRHNVPRDEVAEHGNDTAPGIIIEINDSTINVYMRATIWTKHEQIPGNRYSHSRDDLIKVYTRTY